MNRTISIIILSASFFLSACSSNVIASSIHLDASEYGKNAGRGEFVDFPITIRHDIQGNSAVNVSVIPASNNKWKFALCYDAECFISNGTESIEKTIALRPNTTMEIDIKIFIPNQIGGGNSCTVELGIRNTTTPQMIKTASFTATVR